MNKKELFSPLRNLIHPTGLVDMFQPPKLLSAAEGNPFVASALPRRQRRFRLLRNFSLISLTAFVIAVGSLSVISRQLAIKHLVRSTEEKNLALTRMFSNTLWQEYGSFLLSTQGLSDAALAQHPQTLQLYQDTVAQLEGLAVLNAKVFDLQGRTVFSTDQSKIGADKSASVGFQMARTGEVLSQLNHRDTFQALRGTVTDRDLLSSYVPIYADGVEGRVVGVFELYTDVTPLLQRVNRTQRRITLGSLVLFAGLYGVLFLFMRRADYLLETQYRQVQTSETLYRTQAKALEQALTQLQQTQAQMLQSEKMSSLGQMVAGVAHEINNPASFIHGNLDHIQAYTEDLLRLLRLYQQHYPVPAPEIEAEIAAIDLAFLKEDVSKVLASMNVGSRRIREIVLALRIFSRLDEASIKSVDIQEGLESTLLILQHRLKANAERDAIQVVCDFASLPLVECHGGLMNQVFMNLLANGIDALDEKARSQVQAGEPVTEARLTLSTAVIEDRWVEIAIADNGTGMSADVQAHIFEPFYTTKPVGKGTGMGLSISYQIVTERHHGRLVVTSKPGQGTRFLIQIPLQYQTVSGYGAAKSPAAIT